MAYSNINESQLTLQEVCMATSSIFANFDIKNKKNAEEFVEALDKSENYNAEKKIINYDELNDSVSIKTLWSKRKK